MEDKMAAGAFVGALRIMGRTTVLALESQL